MSHTSSSSAITEALMSSQTQVLPAAAAAATTAPTTPTSDHGRKNPFIKQLNKYFTPPVQLQDWKDMPRHLQFNPYVLKGKVVAVNFIFIFLAPFFVPNL